MGGLSGDGNWWDRFFYDASLCLINPPVNRIKPNQFYLGCQVVNSNPTSSSALSSAKDREGWVCSRLSFLRCKQLIAIDDLRCRRQRLRAKCTGWAKYQGPFMPGEGVRRGKPAVRSRVAPTNTFPPTPTESTTEQILLFHYITRETREAASFCVFESPRHSLATNPGKGTARA